jgi:hypothetical protein
VTEPARKRRWPKFLAAFAVLLLIGAWWVNRQLEPNRLTALVLDRAGTALGLELTIEGTPEYALRPEPRLVLPKLTARQPGAAAPLLTAARAEVSLPWSTLTDGGALVITRVELERPVLDLAALAAWQTTRPEAPFELPTFTKGLRVVDGTVLGEGWALDMLGLELASLLPGQRAEAKLSGQFERQATFVLFEGDLGLASAGLASDFDLVLEGRLRDGELNVPLSLGAGGHFDANGDTTALRFDLLRLRSASPLPDLDASGTAQLGDNTTLALEGSLPSWPEDWPALPSPLAESTAAIDFTLGYSGAADFSAPLSLSLVREQTRAEAALAVPELLAWLEQTDASPLPPLRATVETPSLAVGGVTLEGVRISIEEDDAEAEGQAGEDAASEETP